MDLFFALLFKSILYKSSAKQATHLAEETVRSVCLCCTSCSVELKGHFTKM